MSWPSGNFATERTITANRVASADTLRADGAGDGAYVGRFAPSPTGPLHQGSLLTAVASFLHARRSGGAWLVRIDDIDPPREVPGAAASILRTLEAMDLPWDGPVLYQSSRTEAYAAAAARLTGGGLTFECSCTRKQLRAAAESRGLPLDSVYPGTCRSRSVHARRTALRVRVDSGDTVFVDGLQGRIDDLVLADYVIYRRDGLPAYHLAAVVDDDFQRVTTVVRGVDLLQATAPQRHLQSLLDIESPAYYHVPVLVDARGVKLSKQHGAEAVDIRDRSALAARMLSYLGVAPPAEIRTERPAIQWEWALSSWNPEALRSRQSIVIDAEPTTTGVNR